MGRSLFDETFYKENKEKHFYQTNAIQLLTNFELTFIMATLRAEAQLQLPVKKCNSCLCCKARFTQMIVV